MAGLGFDDSAPRVISSKTHSIIDYIHSATNLAMAAAFRDDRKASYAALALGLGVLGNALMTDYELGVFRLYSFKVHGILDYGVAAASALVPTLLDLDSTAASVYFRAQGAGETGIAAISDYDDNSGARRIHPRLKARRDRAA